MLALIDCNNFFVSCERLFKPAYRSLPTVVLSSNDGCAVARSNEAKAYGVKMGEPLFKLRDRFSIYDGTKELPRQIPPSLKPTLIVFSANFKLYGNISRRILSELSRITPRIEAYSIDESFLDLEELLINDYLAWGQNLASRINNSVGIPISIGIAPTKTLAKLAAHYAKKHPLSGGSCVIDSLDSALPEIRSMAISDIWGIGWRLAPKLRAAGIHTAADLANMRPQHAKQLMGIQGRRLVAELNGTSCYTLKSSNTSQQVISRGRQFGSDIHKQNDIEAALATMTARACRDLRSEKLLATHASARISTHRLKPNYRSVIYETRLATPSADTGYILSKLLTMLRDSYDSSLAYHRAEVTLTNLISSHQLQTDIFKEVSVAQHIHSTALMETLDYLNKRYGNGTLSYAGEKLSGKWRPRRASRTQDYTGNWNELPRVIIKNLIYS